MNIKLTDLLLNEVFDDYYKWSNGWKYEDIDVEDEETGEEYKKTVFSPVQIIRFKTDAGIPYVWYARQNRFSEDVWEIAFGVEKGLSLRGGVELDIEKTKTGDAFKVLSTVIQITNRFIEKDEEDDLFSVNRIRFTSKSPNRTNLYLKRLVPRIEHFELEHVSHEGIESDITLIRNWP